jgi:hypothetical protein
MLFLVLCRRKGEILMRHGVIILPGIITPAMIAYARFADLCDGSARVIAKELAIYETDAPPPDYGFETEINGILRRRARPVSTGFTLAAIRWVAPCRLRSRRAMQSAWSAVASGSLPGSATRT